MTIRSFLNVVAEARTTVAILDQPGLTRAPYAQLGDLMFELVGPITGLQSQRVYSYAKMEVIEAKPRLQATGDELENLTLTLAFDLALQDPASAYAQLVAIAAAHQVVPFIFTSGQILGRYVITDIDDTVDVTDASGAITRRTTRVKLLEWVEDAPLEIATRARSTAAIANTAAGAKKTAKPTTHYIPDPPLDVMLRQVTAFTATLPAP